MLTVNDCSVVVPPIPTPRKNKLKIHGNFTLIDLLVVLPILLIGILIMIFVKMPVWGLIVVFGCFAIVGGLLVWPMGFLGKEKIYMFVIRGLKFILATHRHLQTEQSQNQFDNVVQDEPKKDSSKKEESFSKPDYEEQPKDLMTRILAKFKNKKEKQNSTKKEKK